ncbi:cation:proton antiporter subunit C [Halorussus salinisoli]|uniref:cation:proton antiporter subunit C n=1 Tax=Halorussus salinisoli TaxID=2558242 RepID=UPI0010C19B77|nr:cation:proton antiporter subunit C [Halorussus salinisoli]
MIDLFLARLNYVGFVVLVGVGLFVLIDDDNLVKKVIGLNVFQTGVLLFFITTGYRTGGSPPIVEPGGGPYANPLPQVLVLTAIVVGVSVTAVALALVVRIHREYGTLREDVLREGRIDESRNGPDGESQGGSADE